MRRGLTARLLVATAALAIVVAVSFAVLLRALREERAASALVAESERVLVAANELERLVIDLETGQRGFILTGEERFLDPWTTARGALPDGVRTLETATIVSSQDARARRIGDAIDAYLRDYSVPLVEAAQRGDPSASSVAVTADGKARVDALRTQFDQLITEEHALSVARGNRADGATRWAIAAATGGLAGSIVIILAYGGYLTRSIVVPLRRASAMAVRLAGGDLGARMAETGAGEIGTLERSFNTMATSLQQSTAELAASRSRVVAAADDAHRRIERDLHDGVQQRLVSLGLELRATEAALPPDLDDVKGQLLRTTQGLVGAVVDLQEVSRGIHPAILSKGGLGPAIKTLARRSGLPVELHLQADRRLPEAVEVAAYYVVSEGLTNAAKHAEASAVWVDVDVDERSLRLSVRDDGVGGVDPQRGSGLVGLRDRVDAVGGSMDVTSTAGAGTAIVVTMPLDPDPG
jgi:signal transduction histidine kinase